MAELFMKATMARFYCLCFGIFIGVAICLAGMQLFKNAPIVNPPAIQIRKLGELKEVGGVMRDQSGIAFTGLAVDGAAQEGVLPTRINMLTWYTNGIVNGWQLTLNSNADVMQFATYQSGIPSGTWMEFYSSGRPKRLEVYEAFEAIKDGEAYTYTEGFASGLSRLINGTSMRVPFFTPEIQWFVDWDENGNVKGSGGLGISK